MHCQRQKDGRKRRGLAGSGGCCCVPAIGYACKGCRPSIRLPTAAGAVPPSPSAHRRHVVARFSAGTTTAHLAPELAAHLVAALADLDVDNLARHGGHQLSLAREVGGAPGQMARPVSGSCPPATGRPQAAVRLTGIDQMCVHLTRNTNKSRAVRPLLRNTDGRSEYRSCAVPVWPRGSDGKREPCLRARSDAA